MKRPKPLDLRKLKVLPLEQRRSLTRVEDILVPPNDPAAEISTSANDQILQAAQSIRRARAQDAAVILMYGAHLLRNGAALKIGRAHV